MRVTGEHMETTEKIVEVYVRYVRRWATIPEHPTHGRFEISGDRSRYLGRYHIETGISASKVLASDVRFWPPKRTWASALHMSAFGGKADIGCPLSWRILIVERDPRTSKRRSLRHP
jgi:hypothetical protein